MKRNNTFSWCFPRGQPPGLGGSACSSWKSQTWKACNRYIVDYVFFFLLHTGIYTVLGKSPKQETLCEDVWINCSSLKPKTVKIHEGTVLFLSYADSYETHSEASGPKRLCSSTVCPPLEIDVTEEELRLLRSVWQLRDWCRNFLLRNIFFLCVF